MSSAFDKLKEKGEQTFLSFTARIKAYGLALKNVTDQLTAQQKAYDAYMAKANSTGLSEEWKSKIQNGQYSIDDVGDDNLKQQINDYKTWYEKAAACKDKLDELKKTQAEITQAKIETVITKYDKLKTKAEKPMSVF